MQMAVGGLGSQSTAKRRWMALTEEMLQDTDMTIDNGISKCEQLPLLRKTVLSLSRSFSRHVVSPDISADDLAKESADVQGIAAQVHTSDVKAAFDKHLKGKSTLMTRAREANL